MRKIKLVELFAGYGSQTLALKRLGYEIDENSEIVEWGVAPAIAYKILNHSNATGKINDDMLQMLVDNQALSNDTKSPAKKINKTKVEALKEAIYQTKNYCDVKKYDIAQKFDLLTYSFPCQDISNQGSRQGFEKGSGTRSGLLWEVERMLNKTEHKPKYLLMENVKALVGKKNMDNFQEWIDTLEKLGYKSEWKILNSAHFGIGQNRERVFMLSVREDVLTTELEDFKNIKGTDHKTPFKKHTMSLEEIENSPWPINEKDLYLNEFELLPGQSGNYRLGNHILGTAPIKKANSIYPEDDRRYSNMRSGNAIYDETVSTNTLTANGENQNQKVFSKFKSNTFTGSEENPARTLDTRMMSFDQSQIKVFSSFSTALQITSDGPASTLTTLHGNFDSKAGQKVFNKLDLNNRVNKEENPSQTAMAGMTSTSAQQLKVYQLIQQNEGIVRFVRPLEKARIMGLTDDEFWKLYNNPALSSNQIESMFGNSIVVDVLEEIFKVLKIQGE